MMTTMAALLGGVAAGAGHAAWARSCGGRSGITIIGGLILSQMLTLYTTPVIYLFFDAWRTRFARRNANARRVAATRSELVRSREASMNISAPFIQRPVATTLLTVAVALAGVVAFRSAGVAAAAGGFPTISVSASLPGASPETMASSVATPLERQFGRIAGVTEMTSQSTLGQTSVTLQFDLNRNIDAAARDVQAAINAARGIPAGESARAIRPTAR